MIAREEEVVDYIREYNAQVEESGDGLLSAKCCFQGAILRFWPIVFASWLAHLAENGIRQIRIGSKELAFRLNVLIKPSLPCWTGSMNSIRTSGWSLPFTLLILMSS